MRLRQTGLLPCVLGILPSIVSSAERPAVPGERATIELPTTPLETQSTTRVFEGNFIAWAGPAFCDYDQNAYFLVIPQPSSRGGTTGPDPYRPSALLRVAADGKNKTRFNPTASPKLAGATDLSTVATAVDRDGGVFLLVWAQWRAEGARPERGAQYLVSFDRKGEHRSTVEVDWHEILVHQFEVFGSGQFLLRGRRTDTPETRIAIFPEGGGALRDVSGWAGFPAAPLEEPTPGIMTTTKFDQMARGGDGRIYVVQQETQPDRDVVYAFDPSGQTEEVFQLRVMPKHPRLLGWKVAGDRFAATYLEPQPGAEASGEVRGKWWIAVYSNVAGAAEPPEPTVYGPASGPPICYQHKGSKDVFTFLQDGAKLVSMSPP